MKTPDISPGTTLQASFVRYQLILFNMLLPGGQLVMLMLKLKKQLVIKVKVVGWVKNNKAVIVSMPAVFFSLCISL